MQNDNEANGESKRPQNTDFKQQRLKAWQPILTPKYVICSFTAIAIVFLAIGIALLLASQNVFERTQRYDNVEECRLAGDSDFSNICEVTIPIDEDVDLPIFVYYELDNFFQNHRRYVKSRSDPQLRGEDSSSFSACDPLETFNDRTLYPCGLIAHSYFSDQIIGALERGNDTFSLVPTTNYSTVTQATRDDFTAFEYSTTIPSWRKQGIAWQSDIDAKFGLLESLNGDIGNLDTTRFTREGPEQQRINRALAIPANESGSVLIPSPLDEDLIVWMRAAGLPKFKKLYRRIESLDGAVTSGPTNRLVAGDTLRFKVRNFFRVEEFDGQKSIVVSTVSFVGGKNDFLGIAYLVVGSIILFLAVAFLIKHLVSPRKLGDMRYFNWNANDGRQRNAN